MEQMVKDARFAYMSGLSALRNYLAAIRWDMSKRDWVGKNVDRHGFLHIAPENFSPGMVEDLLKYCLTLDALEMEAADREGLDTPRFRLIPADVLVLIDALWSYFGIQRPFHALKIYRDIHIRGMRYPIPVIAKPAPRVRMGSRRYLHVGDLMSDSYLFFGLRDPQLETFGRTCYEDMYAVKNGKQYLNISTADFLTVNEEGIWFLLEYDLDRLIEEYDNPQYMRTSGFMWYLTCGMVSLGKSQHSRADMVLRRSRLREDKGLVWPYSNFDFDADSLSVADYSALTGSMPADIAEGVTIPLF